MVGLAIAYSPFERTATRPKLNAMRFCYGVGSNFITSAPPEFEDLLCLRMMKLRPLLAAENFHNKLRILLEAVIGCQTSSAT